MGLEDIAHWATHPVLTLTVALFLAPSAVLILLGLLILFKGVPMLVWGRDTMRDVSAHMSSLTLLGVVLFPVYPILSVFVVVLAAPAAWSRVRREAHLPSMTLLGVVLGYIAYLIYATGPFPTV